MGLSTTVLGEYVLIPLNLAEGIIVQNRGSFYNPSSTVPFNFERKFG
jgi:hypothetical protein